MFISQLENKIKELESSNRLLRLKVLSSPEPMEEAPDQHSKTNRPRGQHVGSGHMPSLQCQPEQRSRDYATDVRPVQVAPYSTGYDHLLRDMNSRLLSLEVKMLEGRMEKLESRFSAGTYEWYPHHMPTNPWYCPGYYAASCPYYPYAPARSLNLTSMVQV